MRRSATRLVTLAFFTLLLRGLAACESSELGLIESLGADQSFSVAALQKTAHLVRTEDGVPHIFAATQHDAAYVLGFVTASDRYLQLDLARRLGEGRLAEELGEAGLAWDTSARITGIAYLADQVDAQLNAGLTVRLEAYRDGINDYVSRVLSGSLPVPTDLRFLAELLGVPPATLVTTFERRDLSAIEALGVYRASFSDDDVRRSAAAITMVGAFAGAPDSDLRQAGLAKDIWSPVAPLFAIASAPGLGLSTGASIPRSDVVGAPTALVTRVAAALDRMQVGLDRDRRAGYGSNAWAVSADASGTGVALLAGDAHLPLSIPSALYSFGVDTKTMGGDDFQQLGLGTAGLPVLRFGTNGHVAFSQTQLGEDVTDWFHEEVQLDTTGAPMATRFGSEWKPVLRTGEAIGIGAPPRLGGTARTETWVRYQTFDGRWLTDFEGHTVPAAATLPAGQARVRTLSGVVVPADEDEDGVVRAISFAYAGLAAGSTIAADDAMGHSADVGTYAAAMHGLVGSSQASVVADTVGRVAYASYQAMPCRADLPRNPDGSFAAGANPTLLLDGTKHGAWHVAIKDGLVDESTTDAATCVIPFSQMPLSLAPSTGFALAANNDPAGFSFDGSIMNDEIYVGGPWDLGFRADTIDHALRAQIAQKAADLEATVALQADVVSRQGRIFVPSFLAALQHARTAEPALSDVDARLATLYATGAPALDEVTARLTRWQANGLRASSGVTTFYDHPDDVARDDAASTMIFNAWLAAFGHRVLDDEDLGALFGYLGPKTQTRVLVSLLAGRGAAGESLLASWEPTRMESVFFDDVRTTVIESSDEEIVLALADALAALRAQPLADGTGGFGSNDMSTWLWGLRHVAQMPSSITDHVTDSVFTALAARLQIDTRVLPLVRGAALASDDPRGRLRWFPRSGDAYAVDAADPSDAARGRYAYSSGAAMRMSIQISEHGVRGWNVLPGGESSDPTSPSFADQADAWLGNNAFPLRLSAGEVARASTRHEVFSPTGL